MLVRCIVLSLDRFESQTEDVKGESPMEFIWFQRNLLFSSLLIGLSCVTVCVRAPVVEVLSECCLLSYMARVENRLSFLFRLINIINVQTLTQVCFPNRAQHSYEVSRRCLDSHSFRTSLPRRALQENVSCLNTSLVILMLARRKAKLPFYLNALREKEYAEKYPGCLLNNFHNLLRFWQRHYLNKDKDSTCLENVSGLRVLAVHTGGTRGSSSAESPPGALVNPLPGHTWFKELVLF